MIALILELYSRCGISLREQGVNEGVLPIITYDYVIELFSKNKLLILGGDLYKKDVDGNLINIYANWYYDDGNVDESAEQARSYLSQFLNKDLYVSYILKQAK